MMAGIGFELRKMFREQGMVNQLKAYAYSSLTTIGPMILSMGLIVALQRITATKQMGYANWELYIATVSYCFIFSIVFTSGISMVLTRYTADMLYEKKYSRLMSAYYGALIVMLPIAAVVGALFLSAVSAGWMYKASAYFFFLLLIIVWIQGVFLSALKDYVRIVRGFAIGSVAAVCSGWVLSRLTTLDSTVTPLISLDIGFLLIVILSNLHFEQRFPRAEQGYYFEYLGYMKKYASLFFAGCFVYSGIYLHNFVYWLSPGGRSIADQFLIMPFYDLPVFYAFLTVLPTFVTFVVSVETAFYEKFRLYYLNIVNGGTIQDIKVAKQQMQKTLMKQVSFLVEVQLLFTILSIALGIKFLPKIGFTMAQLDLFIILSLAYFLFIIFFVLTHILMYFDDRKGVLGISAMFAIFNILFSYWMMNVGFDGLGMFIASAIAVGLVFARLLYVLRNIDYYTFCSQPITLQTARKKHRQFGKAASTAFVLVVSTMLLSACTFGSSIESNEEEDVQVEEIVNRASMPNNINTQLTEDERLYERDDDSSLKTLYITVLPKKKNKDESLDWYGLNRKTEKTFGEKLPIIMQEGFSDEDAPRSGMFGYGTTVENATIQLRGRSAWNQPQKSFRIKLNDEAGLYMGQQTVNLNKHISEFSRVRNKLSFDLMETIPNITSLRTQFIHLYVKDLSTGAKEAPYEDYGLFTHVEQPNKKFLKSHMLDPNGYLYKVNFFEFDRYEDFIKEETDPDFDLEKFETILEVKGRKEHGKLIKMLDDVNNLSMPIEDVMSLHFDEENFLTWTAINILMDNMDTEANNFFLYSPINNNKWYILPWDYDGGWELQRKAKTMQTFQTGISNYWVSKLANRYFRKQGNVDKLTAKIEELHKNYINEQTIAVQLERYRDIVEPFLYRYPDTNFLPSHAGDYDEELQIILQTPEASLRRYYEDLEKPKPYYMHDVEDVGDKLKFAWGLSFDLQDDELFYDIAVSRNLEFTDIVFEKKDISLNSIEIEKLPPGTYYWKSGVRDEHGNRQDAFDLTIDDDEVLHDGVREFEVE
ncbi:exopolysaccharide Pel transporter PelG [Sporosarcina oncorhynchi]|uniref:Exopolysaccharide Pel transporter PelG n=1 Tax=Sporosarcina oncorhynchi TaxID=3056444 RepID=A0ABZ0L2I5_9BACL|nr:exopolysaccharide Pel transporter PelG [Sporosarcina sp. T2O-4]WOV86826.1 exopolysaccharide Pel transporter PelG [Sporosarcina sp. T2O-4]